MGVSGISSPFGGLSRSSGQVPHVLLTRSPLGLPQCCHWLDLVRLACVKHAASVRPEPGSNSPSRSSAPEGRKSGEPAVGLTSPSDRLAPRRTLSVVSALTVEQPPRWLPALAFGFPSVPFSRSTMRWARVSQRALVPVPPLLGER